MPDYRPLLSTFGVESAPVADWQSYLDQGLLTQTTTPWGSTVYTPGAKAPTTQYGSPLDVRAYDVPSGQAAGGFKLRNPNLTYNDPNYGMITPGANTIDPAKQTNWMDFLGPAVMAAVTLGAGSLPAFGAEAAMAGTGAVAGDAFMPAFGYEAGMYGPTSIPWYAKAGLNVAREFGGGVASTPGVSPAVQQSVNNVNAQMTQQQAAPTPAAPAPGLTAYTPPAEAATAFGYDPTAYGDMNNMANLPDGSQMVATSVAPNAYENSYTQVIS